jgi:hypothetical protein
VFERDTVKCLNFYKCDLDFCPYNILLNLLVCFESRKEEKGKNDKKSDEISLVLDKGWIRSLLLKGGSHHILSVRFVGSLKNNRQFWLFKITRNHVPCFRN